MNYYKHQQEQSSPKKQQKHFQFTNTAAVYSFPLHFLHTDLGEAVKPSMSPPFDLKVDGFDGSNMSKYP